MNLKQGTSSQCPFSFCKPRMPFILGGEAGGIDAQDSGWPHTFYVAEDNSGSSCLYFPKAESIGMRHYSKMYFSFKFLFYILSRLLNAKARLKNVDREIFTAQLLEKVWMMQRNWGVLPFGSVWIRHIEGQFLKLLHFAHTERN